MKIKFFYKNIFKYKNARWLKNNKLKEKFLNHKLKMVNYSRDYSINGADMFEFQHYLHELTQISISMQNKLFFTLIGVFVLLFLRFIARKVITRKINDPVKTYHWNKLCGYIYVVSLIIMLLKIWLQPNTSFLNILGLLSAALTLALQDMVKSLAGWLYILWRRPFYVGDRIQVGDLMGDVIDVSALKFSINEINNWVEADQSTGRVMHIPNSIILSKPIINYTEGFQYIWNPSV